MFERSKDLELKLTITIKPHETEPRWVAYVTEEVHAWYDGADEPDFHDAYREEHYSAETLPSHLEELFATVAGRVALGMHSRAKH